MKKCEYCAKEISYHEIYCCDDCQTNANKFYEVRDKISKLMGVINGVSVLSIGIGLFVYSMIREVGAFMVAIPTVILGILFLFFPIPADVMIQKYKIKKAVQITRIIAVVLLVFGIAATIFAIFST
ncbi:MAG: hypothetical protein IJ433_03310 [Ruminococcus sp.]|nr:hypothetical protein [Ruminococcus sp.]